MDIRLEKRLVRFRVALSTYQTVKIRQLSNGHTEEMANYRLLSNAKMTEHAIARESVSFTHQHTAGRHVLVLADSTDFDYSSQRGRIKSGTGLGFIGNGGGLGYNAHVSLAVDAASESIYGLSNIHLWHREAEHTQFRQLRNAEISRNQLKKKVGAGAILSIEEEAALQKATTFSVAYGEKTYTSSYQYPREGRKLPLECVF